MINFAITIHKMQTFVCFPAIRHYTSACYVDILHNFVRPSLINFLMPITSDRNLIWCYRPYRETINECFERTLFRLYRFIVTFRGPHGCQILHRVIFLGDYLKSNLPRIPDELNMEIKERIANISRGMTTRVFQNYRECHANFIRGDIATTMLCSIHKLRLSQNLVNTIQI